MYLLMRMKQVDYSLRSVSKKKRHHAPSHYPRGVLDTLVEQDAPTMGKE